MRIYFPVRKSPSTSVRRELILLNLIFIVLSAMYIGAIFLLSDSPMVSNMAKFNPYSLLHIPLYGILTGILILSISPVGNLRKKSKTQIHSNNLGWQSKNKIILNNSNSQLRESIILDLLGVQHSRIFPDFVLAGLIASITAVLDEIHQKYLPNRDGSLSDVLLDMVGIAISIILGKQLYKNRNLIILKEKNSIEVLKWQKLGWKNEGDFLHAVWYYHQRSLMFRIAFPFVIFSVIIFILSITIFQREGISNFLFLVCLMMGIARAIVTIGIDDPKLNWFDYKTGWRERIPGFLFGFVLFPIAFIAFFIEWIAVEVKKHNPKCPPGYYSRYE